MPSSDYEFLSDRQREYLQNPDDFDSQRSAELSYRIRQKISAIQEDFELLRDTVPSWDKTETIFSVVLKCHFRHEHAGPAEFGGCDNTRVIDDWIVDPESLKFNWETTVDDWDIRDNYGISTADDADPVDEQVIGTCPECLSQAFDYACRNGTVPCYGNLRDSHPPSHEPGSKAFNNCGLLALTDEQLVDIYVRDKCKMNSFR